jgi:DNA-binding MarR family transcriptional regulator
MVAPLIRTQTLHAGGVRSEFHILIHDISRLQRTLFDDAVKPLNTTRAQWWILRALDAHGAKGLTQSAISRSLSIGKVSIGKVMSRMEQAELVQREDVPGDARAHNLVMTAKGTDLLASTVDIERQVTKLIYRGLGSEMADDAGQVLIRARVNMTGRGSGVPPPGARDPNWVGFLINDVSRLRRTMMDRLLKPLGMTRAQWRLLNVLARHDGMAQVSLAEELHLTRMGAGNLIVRLEGLGLVERAADPIDMRVKRVYLTKAGAKRVRTLYAESADTEDVVLAGVDVADIVRATVALRRMKANILAALNPASRPAIAA